MRRKIIDAPDLTHIAEQLRGLAVPMDQVHLDPKNAKEHDTASITAIAASLRQYGQLKPIIANRQNGQIEAGNGTYLAACSLAWPSIAVVWVDHDPRQQRGFSIADNRSAEFARWNQDVLDELLGEIREETPDLYAELLLADLERQPDPPAAAESPPAKEKPPHQQSTYQVIVECSDAHDRQRLMRSLRKQGRRCRALTWDGVVASPGDALPGASFPAK